MKAVKSITRVLAMGLVGVGIACFVAPDAQSATKTDTFKVKAHVKKRCRITGVDFDFGEYDPVDANSAADLEGQGEVKVRCNKGTTAHVGFDLGANANVSTRRMAGLAGVADMLDYELYSDAARSVVWGNADPAWVAYTAANFSETSIAIYGSIAQAQDVSVGDYEDTITATINF